MRQAVWKRKGKNNDHRDIGEWRNGRWYHFLEKGEKCLGHKGKGDWICHNHAGKDKKVSQKKKVIKRVEKKGILPKESQNLKLLSDYQKLNGFQILDTPDLKKAIKKIKPPKVKRNRKKDRNEEWLKKQGKGFTLGDLF
jgi:hypothetical protein